jgi:hypothetical protein
MPNRFGGVGISLPLNQLGAPQFGLQPGEVFLIPSGFFNISIGPALSVQVLNPVTNTWLPIGAQQAGNGQFTQLDSDGNNYRIANQTGCVIGAVITNAGSGYTSAPTVVASAGSSTWSAIVGGAVSTTVTIPTGGSNYVYPPAVVIQSPPTGGIPATGYATITAGAVTGVTIQNQGAGYTTAPYITLLNDPRDTTGSGGTASATLTGSQTVTGLLCTNHGTALASSPTLTFSGGGGSAAAATVLMDQSVTSVAYTAGSGFTDGSKQVTTTGTGLTSLTPIYTNPATQQGLLRPVPAFIIPGGSTTFSATGNVIVNPGHFYSATGVQTVLTGVGGTGAAVTLTFGGFYDTFWLQQG